MIQHQFLLPDLLHDPLQDQESAVEKGQGQVEVQDQVRLQDREIQGEVEKSKRQVEYKTKKKKVRVTYTVPHTYLVRNNYVYNLGMI